MFNEQLFPRLGITDWLFKFGSLEEKDERKLAETYQIKVDAVVTLRNAGIEAIINEHGEIEVSDWPSVEEALALQATKVGALPQKTKISESTGAQIEGTSTERAPSGPRGDTDK